ncbi:hypothetical protein QQP08_023079 [Theobroma cacao]|nr:hypothetical protein QQP08_023079 [Theobroma cacao]
MRGLCKAFDYGPTTGRSRWEKRTKRVDFLAHSQTPGVRGEKRRANELEKEQKSTLSRRVLPLSDLGMYGGTSGHTKLQGVGVS